MSFASMSLDEQERANLVEQLLAAVSKTYGKGNCNCVGAKAVREIAVRLVATEDTPTN
jgi:hypothetical protein